MSQEQFIVVHDAGARQGQKTRLLNIKGVLLMADDAWRLCETGSKAWSREARRLAVVT